MLVPRIAAVQQVEEVGPDLVFLLRTYAKDDPIKRKAVVLALMTALPRIIADVAVEECSEGKFDLKMSAPRVQAPELIGLDAGRLNVMLNAHPYLQGPKPVVS